VKEYSVFIPYDREHLAAVITVPEQDPTGLVLLTTGTGAPRSHRFQLWTRLARRLAEDGLASVRMDYLGIGDSSGRILERRMGELEKRVDEALAVARFSSDAVGTSRLITLGNCSGGLIGLGVAAKSPTCVGAICILPRVLQPTKANEVVIGLRRSRLASLARSNALLRPIAQSLRGRKGKPRPGLTEWVASVLARGSVLFVFSEADTDAYNERARQQIERMISRLPQPQQKRFELRLLPGGPLSGFESLDIQQDVIDAVEEWTAAALDPAGRGGLQPVGATDPSLQA
jgi:alpha/beta superfamily hydrolase